REGEKLVLQTQDRHLVVRVSWLFGPDRPSFIDGMIKRARASECVDAVSDKFSTPTYTRDIAEMLLPILTNDWSRRAPAPAGSEASRLQPDGPRACHLHSASGILHVVNTGQCSWQEYAQHAIDCCHKYGVPLKATKVGPLKMKDMKNWIARRPVNSVLSTEKYIALTSISPRSWR